LFTKWSGGDVVVEMDNLIDDYGFVVEDSSSVEKVRLGFDQGTSSALLELKSLTGTFLEANNDELKINGDVVYVDEDSLNLGTLANDSGYRLNIETADSINPISIHENRVGGASQGDSFAIEFFYNDSSGTKTLAGSIASIVSAPPTAGDIPMDMYFNDNLKIQNNNRVLITPSVATLAAVAQLEVRGSATTTNTTILAKSGGASASQTVFWAQNSNNKNLFWIQGNGKIVHNQSNLATSDFQMEGLTDAFTFYMDSSADKVGFGTNIPSEKVHSTEKIRADTAFNLNGVDGITEVLTFGGGATGEVATLTVSGGIITARTLVP
jgi:hypothetical protein